MSACLIDINIPTLPEEICDGVYTSDACIIHSGAISYLTLPINSSINTVINALVLALIYKDEQINSLTARVVILETP